MWRLDSHLTACIASGRIILLDQVRDRYFAVPDESSAAVHAWLTAADGSDPPAAFANMVDSAQPGRLTNEQRVDVWPPHPTFAQATSGRVDLPTILSVAHATVTSWLLLRGRKLHRILARHRAARSAGATLEASALADCAQRFASARRWCPIKRNCLLDTLAFDRWIAHPRNVAIVFGVAAKPFEAHCWLQSEATVLNDGYDRVSRFEPILTV